MQSKTTLLWPRQCRDAKIVHLVSVRAYAKLRRSLAANTLFFESLPRYRMTARRTCIYSTITNGILLPIEFVLLSSPSFRPSFAPKTLLAAAIKRTVEMQIVVGTWNLFQLDFDPKQLYAPSLCSMCPNQTKKQCTGCSIVYYCSKQCQRNGWAQHKLVCAILKDVTDGAIVIEGKAFNVEIVYDWFS